MQIGSSRERERQTNKIYLVYCFICRDIWVSTFKSHFLQFLFQNDNKENYPVISKLFAILQCFQKHPLNFRDYNTSKPYLVRFTLEISFQPEKITSGVINALIVFSFSFSLHLQVSLLPSFQTLPFCWLVVWLFLFSNSSLNFIFNELKKQDENSFRFLLSFKKRRLFTNFFINIFQHIVLKIQVSCWECRACREQAHDMCSKS